MESLLQQSAPLVQLWPDGTAVYPAGSKTLVQTLAVRSGWLLIALP